MYLIFHCLSSISNKKFPNHRHFCYLPGQFWNRKQSYNQNLKTISGNVHWYTILSFCGFYCVSIAIYDSRVICCAKRTTFLEQKPLLKRNFDISDYRVCFCSKNGLLFNLESLKALVFVSFMFYLTTECISWYFQTINNDL